MFHPTPERRWKFNLHWRYPPPRSVRDPSKCNWSLWVEISISKSWCSIISVANVQILSQGYYFASIVANAVDVYNIFTLRQLSPLLEVYNLGYTEKFVELLLCLEEMLLFSYLSNMFQFSYHYYKYLFFVLCCRNSN